MSYKALFANMDLAGLIEQAELRPFDRPNLPTHSETGALITYKGICYFHLHDPILINRYGPMLVRVNTATFYENRFVDIPKEGTNEKRVIRHGVCSPCAERLGMAFRPTENT